ncbi:hypothetical protein J2Y69_001445 [Microbacterium resistens]|uniref:DUF559 domain-containing protein n=1 Tax=Microbacterium resistens TaxID=156977 RepID=A0ABU1SB77_9MICO|nr:DUF559 domain-containing protein [Microbacterium resistens]MDR6866846.1 hypothetical protein [Microbacterium resistens]
MGRAQTLPNHLGDAFSVRAATELGVGRGRLRRRDLARPFPGVRVRIRDGDPDEEPLAAGDDPYAQQAAGRLARAREYAPRLRPGQFYSHETAAVLWGAPLPLAFVDDAPADGHALPVHVSSFGTAPLVRTPGVSAHRARTATTTLRELGDIALSSPASTWAALGALPLIDLVAIGDHLCRVWRAGPGRLDAGREPLTSTTHLRTAIDAGRRVGNGRLREAVELIREDSWSPRESALRCRIVLAGLPEPRLNHDVYDDAGRFLACVDLAYVRKKVAIEYHGLLHHSQYARDVERTAALRAAGWTVIEVTAALFAHPDELIVRIRRALRR